MAVNSFPPTSVTLIAKIKNLAPGEDSAAWVRFWDSYALAIRRFAALKGGEANADDIMSEVLRKLVDVLRKGLYSPEKGAFHSYLATMIVNEVRMAHRKDEVRQVNNRVSLDKPLASGESEYGGGKTLAEVLPAAAGASGDLDAEWREAVFQSAVQQVLTRTALSERDRSVYRDYAQENRPIEEVAAKYGISRNLVSQIKTRIDRRIVAVGQRLARGDGLL